MTGPAVEEGTARTVAPQDPPGATATGFTPWWHRLAIPLVIFALTRLGQLLILDWMARDTPLRDRLLSWDAGWFLAVARDGYPRGYRYGSGGELVGNGLAFFPGYPLLVRAAHLVTGLSWPDAALAVSWLSSAVAAVGLYELGTRLYDRRVGVALTVLVCAQPMSVVFSMAYSEGLFVALVAGMLLAAHRESWPVAGLLGLGAALSRPTGAAAAVALAVAAVLFVRRPDSRGRRVRAVVAALVALAGVPGYLLWVGRRVGEWDAWFRIQTAGWGTRFDFGAGVWDFLLDALRGGEGWIQVSCALIVIAAVVAAVVALTRRVWPPLTVYGLLALILVVGQTGYYHSKPRLLVPVLLIMVPAAVAIGRARRSTAVPVLVGYALFGLWYGAYMVTVWRFAI